MNAEGAPIPADALGTIKAVTWNAEKGGYKQYDFDDNLPSIPPHYAEIIHGIETLKKGESDVIALIDTHGWPAHVSADKLAADTGYPTAFIIPLDDDRFKADHTPDTSVSILTRLPVKSHDVIRLHNRNALRITVEKDGKEADIYAVYLDDASRKRRILQTGYLVEEIKKRKKPTIILGDINCTSQNDLDRTSYALRTMLDGMPHMYLRLRVLWKKFFPTKGPYDINDPNNAYDTGLRRNLVFKIMHKALNFTQPLMEKYKDHGPLSYLATEGFANASLLHHQNTMPTPKLLELVPPKARGMVRRIMPFINVDHVLASSEIEIKATDVLQDDVFTVSDHYPRTATLTI